MHNQIYSIPLPLPHSPLSLSDAKITCIYLCSLSKPEGTAKEGTVGFMVLVEFHGSFRSGEYHLPIQSSTERLLSTFSWSGSP